MSKISEFVGDGYSNERTGNYRDCANVGLLEWLAEAGEFEPECSADVVPAAAGLQLPQLEITFSTFPHGAYFASAAAPGDRDAATAINENIKRLGDDDFEVRERAMNNLEAAGMAAVPALEKALTSDDAEVRLRAAQALQRIFERQQLPDLVKKMPNFDPLNPFKLTWEEVEEADRVLEGLGGVRQVRAWLKKTERDLEECDEQSVEALDLFTRRVLLGYILDRPIVGPLLLISEQFRRDKDEAAAVKLLNAILKKRPDACMNADFIYVSKLVGAVKSPGFIAALKKAGGPSIVEKYVEPLPDLPN